MLEIYCGDGKGKTTASLGLALRAAGSGMRVHFVQFLKGGETSELSALELIPNITVLRCDRNYGFTFQMDDTEKEQLKACHNQILQTVLQWVQHNETDMLILDEFFAAYNLHLLDRTLANQIVFMRPEHIELVLTGRDPQQKFLEEADYVSEIQSVKHPYEHGITARRGIEY